MTKNREMSESRRAFFALQGITFPRVGERGRFLHEARDDNGRMESPLEVVGVTASGKTVTVRFVDEWARRVFRAFCKDQTFRVYRRGDGMDGSGWYLPHGRNGPPGEVVFCSDPEAGVLSPWRRVR